MHKFPYGYCCTIGMDLSIQARCFPVWMTGTYRRSLWSGITVALHSCQHLVLIDFNISASSKCELLFSNGFSLHFPDHLLGRPSFHRFIDCVSSDGTVKAFVVFLLHCFS